jgi:osmotically-inducible protein OsmY
MFPEQIPRTDPVKLLRCKDTDPLVGEVQQGHNKNTQADEVFAHNVDEALWKDEAFRATDYDNIEVHVHDSVASLYGHVSSLTNQHRAERVLQTVPGLLGVNNFLIPDDRLLYEVATALGSLEHTHNCKFFTGVSHGIVLLSGTVGDAKVKLLAEKCAASNPNVRGVINSIRVPGEDQDPSEQQFLQPTIGEEIFFLNGISGVVQQVIINPDNRRVIAMTVRGRFTNQRQDLKSLNNGEARQSERIIVLSMDLVRYMTKVSGFLNINSKDKNRYTDFDPAAFILPNVDWNLPYPYCNGDVLFPLVYRDIENQTIQQPHRSPFEVASEDQSLRELLPANDSLGG